MLEFYIKTFGWPMVALPDDYGKDCWGAGEDELINGSNISDLNGRLYD